MLSGQLEGVEAGVEEALRALRQAGSAESARAVAQRALSLPELPERVRSRALVLLGIAEHRLDRYAHAARSLVEALAVVERTGDVRTRIDALRALGVAHAWRGRHSQALLQLTLALADAAVLGDIALLAELLGELARVNLEMRRWAHALELLRRQERLAGTGLAEHDTIRLRLAMAQAHLGLAEYDQAATIANEMAARADAAGSMYLGFVARRDLALAQLRAGCIDAARSTVADARQIAATAASGYEALALAGVEAELAAVTGSPDAAARLGDVVEGWRERGLAAHELDARLLQAEVLLRAGARGEAERTLRVALARARSLGLDLLEEQVRQAMTRLGTGAGLAAESGRIVSDDFAAAADGYVLLEKLGAGAFGAVFRAFDLERGSEVALKRMTGFDRYDGERRRALLASARTELESAARVAHPGIARVLAVGELPDGGVYVVQEFVAGPSLRTLMSEPSGQQAPTHIAATLRRIALALAALHEAGVVHRDIKPDNVLCPAPDRPVLVDLGIAAFLRDGETPLSRGTEGYAAPEQWRLGRADARADLYALGVIAFEWLLGRQPAREERGLLRRSRGLAAADAAAVRAAAGDALGDLVVALLEEDPDGRPGSALAVVQRLELILNSHRPGPGGPRAV